MRRCADRLGPARGPNVLAGLLIAAALVGAPARAATPALDEREALRISQAVVGRDVPDITLLDRQGRPVRLSDYRGKPLLVSFIYTGCFEVCPTQTRALHEAVRGLDRLLSENQFQVVSIGFNQPFDSPQAMRAFAAQHRIDYRNWEFLSPHASTVHALTREFGFSYAATPAGFDHVLGVTVVDASGRIAAQVYGDKLSAEQLGEPLRRLIKNTPLSPGLDLDELIDRVRILCTVYDPETGQYRTDYALLFEVIGGLGFFLTVGWHFVADRRRQRRERLVSATPAATPSATGPGP